MSWLLYIDDDPDDRDLFVDVCKEINRDIECIAVPGGTEAFEKLKVRQAPLCIYIDMNMPVLNGIAVLKILKKDSRISNVPVFILSTSRSPSLEQEAKTSGAKDYIVKPSTYFEFIKLLKQCFAQHS